MLPGWFCGTLEESGGTNGRQQEGVRDPGSKEGSRQGCTAHASLSSLIDEDVCVFKCSVSRETECSRVGKQSFIITLGCNSVLIQFATPNGTCPCFHSSDTSPERPEPWWAGAWSLAKERPMHR